MFAAKAYIGAAVAGIGALVTSLTGGNHHFTLVGALSSALAALTALTAVYSIPNLPPKMPTPPVPPAA